MAVYLVQAWILSTTRLKVIIVKYQKNIFTVRLFSVLLKFFVWLQNIPNRITPPPFRLLQLSSGFWQSRILYIAVRFDIATKIGNDTLNSTEIAELILAQPDATDRMLGFLSAMGIFKKTTNGNYKNNRLSNFLRQDKTNNITAMILLHNSYEFSLPWYEQLEHGISTGDAPFKLSHKQELFQYLEVHQEFNLLFSRAMNSVENLIGDSFIKDFNWGQFHRIIDIGGSKGSKSISIIKDYPQIEALVMDKSAVIHEAQKHWQGAVKQSILDHISFIEGDVFDSVPAAINNKDIYFLSAVLHTFNDNDCVKALSNITQAIGKSGAQIAIFEIIMADSKPDLVSTSFDMQMFMACQGRERSLTNWKDIFSRCQLKLEEVIQLRTFGNILLLRRSLNL